ncbi:hypothetical protein [Rhizobium sp. CECT 9324]|uniref:hypothetical protein n=1 Tax=Rhizobium sp. CECT 9324 TaxID=2845820 RepID=UPI001E395160|nr:hypothetical protein [Rhizobium sp. CECT 9324]CAH0342320.1 hypothetical protein RHI9324_04043 [Rhizobium sp. CECT 9324]CAH0343761.1 hypothetical protein RHI9324_05499 [Rhizobium sp. CECT 9324]
MSKELTFAYMEIRPVHEAHGQIVSYPTFEAYKETGKEADYWTIYGISPEHEATAIGDFKTFKDAAKIMWAIYAPLWKARDAHAEGAEVEDVVSILEDAINQCSNEERI